MFCRLRWSDEPMPRRSLKHGQRIATTRMSTRGSWQGASSLNQVTPGCFSDYGGRTNPCHADLNQHVRHPHTLITTGGESTWKGGQSAALSWENAILPMGGHGELNQQAHHPHDHKPRLAEHVKRTKAHLQSSTLSSTSFPRPIA